MKRLPLTPELIEQIKLAVGSDVDVTDDFAVFECIAINTLPLPGKRGALFENATVSMLTLKQMSDSINSGGHLPMVHGHDLSGQPVGRAFKAGLSLGSVGEPELRVLFYVDPTETKLAAKIDAGSLDEVSVQFLASQILCSECEFDYRGEDAEPVHFYTRTCPHGHEIGSDGVHVRLVGLSQFIELSLVTRGAADKPKIIGKSNSKLQAPLQALAARGFEVDGLYVAASIGDNTVNLDAILTQLSTATTEKATAVAELAVATKTNDQLQARVTELETKLAAAPTVDTELQARADSADAATAELGEARAILTDLFTRLATADGETEITPPDTIAALKAGIEGYQTKLSAILPVGGVSNQQPNSNGVGAKFNASQAAAFLSNRA